MTSKLSQAERRDLSKKAAELAVDADRGVPGAAEQCREIMRNLAQDRRLVVGE